MDPRHSKDDGKNRLLMKVLITYRFFDRQGKRVIARIASDWFIFADRLRLQPVVVYFSPGEFPERRRFIEDRQLSKDKSCVTTTTSRVSKAKNVCNVV
jgi:hypothetical protein